VSAQPAQQTVRSQKEARDAELKTGVRADPLVQAVLARFPGAEIVDVRKPDQPAPLPGGDGDETLEPPLVDDGSVYGADWRSGEDDNI
jgi:DNA polymerase-3 subunit gamma/tau